jgi:pimeloyl-ACP methyl ester carboxylesterase
MEAWRVAMNNLTGFYLAGHSYGGYLCGNYAVKFHQHIKKLILISPVGIRVPDKDQSGYEEFAEKCKKYELQGGKPPPIYYNVVMKTLWKKEMSPFGFIKFMGMR